MNEAKYSVNVRFNLNGYDCQFTARSEEEQGLDTLHKAQQIVAELEKMGATGERRWEAVKNGKDGPNGKETQAPPNPKILDTSGAKGGGPTSASSGLKRPDLQGQTGALQSLGEVACTNCGVVGQVELIGFNRAGVYKQAPKCQACGKWLKQEK